MHNPDWKIHVDEDGVMYNEDGIPWGNNIGILLPLQREDVHVGQVIAFPKSIVPCKNFEALVYVFTEEEDGIAESLDKFWGDMYFYIHTKNFKGSIKTPKNISPGESGVLTIKLDHAAPIEKGGRFLICKEDKTSTRVAVGVVINTMTEN